MGNAIGTRGILRLFALAGILSIAGCVSSSLEETPTPVVPATTSARAPASNSAADEAPDDGSPSADDDLSPAGDAPTSRAGAPSAAPTRTLAPHVSSVRFACRQPAASGRRACDAIRAASIAAPGVHGCNRRVPYCASDLQLAYGLTQSSRSAGRGVTVAIVDAYGYPNAAGDLAVYRRSMELPTCPLSRCLRIVDQSGRTNPLPKPNADPNDDWRIEEALDLDMVSAVCPNCKIVLVQANSDRNTDLSAAAGAALSLGAVAVANPYSGSEENSSDRAYRRAGRVVTASAGSGTGARAPCSYAAVVCVGGTSLYGGGSGRGWSERAWPQSASGCSMVVPKPSWQHVRACKTRAVPDVSAIGDPSTGVAVYESAGGGWQQIGGTSTGAAIVAALFALGPAAARLNAGQWVWQHGAGGAYHHLGRSKRSYDGASGWGTPNGTGGF